MGSNTYLDSILEDDKKADTDSADLKQSLEWWNTMRDVAKSNNMKVEDFAKVLFNSSSASVTPISPRTELKNNRFIRHLINVLNFLK